MKRNVWFVVAVVLTGIASYSASKFVQSLAGEVGYWTWLVALMLLPWVAVSVRLRVLAKRRQKVESARKQA